jgi:hypothetical protein
MSTVVTRARTCRGYDSLNGDRYRSRDRHSCPVRARDHSLRRARAGCEVRNVRVQKCVIGPKNDIFVLPIYFRIIRGIIQIF